MASTGGATQTKNIPFPEAACQTPSRSTQVARTSWTRTWLRRTMTKAFPRRVKPPTFTYSPPTEIGRYPSWPGLARISTVVFSDPCPRRVVRFGRAMLSEQRKPPSRSSTTPPRAAAIAAPISTWSSTPSHR